MMRTYIFLLIFSFASCVHGYAHLRSSEGKLIKWNRDRLVITIDPSVEKLGAGKKIYSLIEDAFWLWNTEAELNFDFVFIRKNCEADNNIYEGQSNCISAVKGNTIAKDEHSGAKAILTYLPQSGTIVDTDIVFFKDAGTWSFREDKKGLSFSKVALHEIGHFLGLAHSEEEEAIMFFRTSSKFHKIYTLHDDDIQGAAALYETTEELENITCAVHAISPPKNSLFKLLKVIFMGFK